MAQLFRESPLPLYADESCVAEQDVPRCLNHFHGINIKLTKCSGITPALRMIEAEIAVSLYELTGFMRDDKAKDLARLQFVSHDENL
jgi:hypothetical protein